MPMTFTPAVILPNTEWVSCATTHHVMGLFSWRRPLEVRGTVVRSIAINVIDRVLKRGARADKCFGHQRVDIPLHLLVPATQDHKVVDPRVIALSLEQAPWFGAGVQHWYRVHRTAHTTEARD